MYNLLGFLQNAKLQESLTKGKRNMIEQLILPKFNLNNLILKRQKTYKILTCGQMIKACACMNILFGP